MREVNLYILISLNFNFYLHENHHGFHVEVFIVSSKFVVSLVCFVFVFMLIPLVHSKMYGVILFNISIVESTCRSTNADQSLDIYCIHNNKELHNNVKLQREVKQTAFISLSNDLIQSGSVRFLDSEKSGSSENFIPIAFLYQWGANRKISTHYILISLTCRR